MPLPPSEPPIDPSPQDTAKPSAPGVTLLVPAFNEENGIEGVVRRLAALDLGVPTEVLVVEDGSSDGTGAKLEQLQKEIPALRVLKHDTNRGYGASLKTGFESACTEVVVITDADDTYPEDRIAELIARVDDGADMAVGARIGAQVKIPLIRRPAKAALRMLASYLGGVRIPDLNSGLRAIRRDVVLKYKGILPEGFSFTTTITLACLTNHHRVDYVTIDYAARTGSSKIRPVRDTLGFTALIIRTVLYFNPLKVFYPVATVIALGLVGSLCYESFLSENAPDLGQKSVLLFVALVQVLSIGLIADLIDKKSRLR